MKTYLVTPTHKRSPFTIKGETISEAAARAGHRLNGPATFANRSTGTTGLSGVFTSYKSLKTGGATSTGTEFHITEVSA